MASKLMDQHTALTQYLQTLLNQEDVQEDEFLDTLLEQGCDDGEGPSKPILPQRNLLQFISFKVGKLQLLVARDEFCGIQYLSQESGFDSSHWYQRSTDDSEESIHLVDVARLVLPKSKLQPGRSELAASQVMLCHNGEIGLLCDEIGKMKTVDPAEIQWRTEATQRSWLAGVIPSQQCAILNIDSIMDEIFQLNSV